MKRLFIVETATGNRWETNSGFHLVMAENMEESKEMTEVEVGQKILSVIDLDKEMKNKKFKTIIDAQVE